VQICSLLRGGIAERGGVRVGHRIIDINGQSVVAVPHEKIVNMLATAVGEVNPTRLLLPISDVMELKSDSKCCQILTVFLQIEIRRIFRLVFIGFGFNFHFGKPSFIHHSPPLGTD